MSLGRSIRAGVLLTSALACSCSRAPGRVDVELARAVVAHYGALASAVYTDAHARAVELDGAVQQLLREPSEASLEAARKAWRAAREPYLQSEVFRFYGGPIDEVELLVNTWPIDESYLEGEGGLIDDAARHPELSEQLLVEANGRGGETSISTGYHVLEFLLWGSDTDDHGPGARPASDYAPEHARRRQYLRLTSALLVEHLARVAEAWAPGRDDFRAALQAMPLAKSLGMILRGMGQLSGPELSGERLTVPYETRDQENEHSCFSDTTHVDVRLDAQGVQNVCTGTYGALRGPGICALVAQLDPELGATLQARIAASVQAASRIPEPFDRALIGADEAPGRTAIRRTIEALQAQADVLGRAASLLAARVRP